MLGAKISILIVCLFLQIVGIVIFMKGFFPIKSAVPGHATAHDYANEPKIINQTENVDYKYDNLVIVLIDALRADFVFSKDEETKMPFLNGLLTSSDALGFKAKSHPPTVTLPRIKAITTGSIPGFIDVVLNFDSKALAEDNIINQFYLSGKKIVFYGDDTWIKLFPDYFIRTDGTTSFFVTDYTEVDNNVTRHIDVEMTRHDWDVMILHYLGLDHIGHLAGPSSPLVKPKLLEMDSIVEKIYRSLQERDRDQGSKSLLVVCGDHGMSDQGSHGGSSLPEVMTPLVLINSQASQILQPTFREVEQIDIAATLSVLMDVQIPKNNLGTVIADTLTSASTRQQLKMVYRNAQQILGVFKQNVQSYDTDDAMTTLHRAIHLHEDWLSLCGNMRDCSDPSGQGSKILTLYRKAMLAMRGRLLSQLAQYDLHAMWFGITILWIALLSLLCGSVIQDDIGSIFTMKHMVIAQISAVLIAMVHTAMCTSSYHSKALCSASFSSGVGLTLVLLASAFLIPLCVNVSAYIRIVKEVSRMNYLSFALLCGTFLHTLSMFSSSFVEEEHQTWYFFTMTLNITLLLNAVLPPVVESQKQSLKMNGAGENVVNNVDFKSQYSSQGSNQELSENENLTSDEKFFQIKDGEESVLQTRRKSGLTIDLMLATVCACVTLIVSRLLRTWNQTGDKWAHLPDVGDWLVRPENKEVLSLSVMLSLITMCVLRSRLHSRGFHLIFVSACCGIFYFRVVTGALNIPGFLSNAASKGVQEARVVYLLIFLLIIYTIHDSSKSSSSLKQGLSYLLSTWIVLSLLLMRPHNIIFIVMESALESSQSWVVIQQRLSCSTMTLIHLWMGQASFFYQGNSNSISTVDVSAGYVGLDEYNAGLITVLMVCSTYAGPVIWFISLLKNLADSTDNNDAEIHRYTSELVTVGFTLALTRSLPLATYTVLCTFQRFHLFVWTVFSPKLLYEAMFTLVILIWCLLMLTARLCLRHKTLQVS